MQALLGPGSGGGAGPPRPQTLGIDAARANLLLAVLACRTAVEIPVAERTPVLRAYLQRWKFEVGMFFDGVGPDSSDAEFAAVADRHPVFALR